ncbi:hypothetical protein NDU88_001412, partial [Pleurodeles waltl]
GFATFHSPAIKQKKGRPSGGLSIWIRTSLLRNSVVTHTVQSKGIQTLAVKYEEWSLEIVNVYFPPISRAQV